MLHPCLYWVYARGGTRGDGSGKTAEYINPMSLLGSEGAKHFALPSRADIRRWYWLLGAGISAEHEPNQIQRGARHPTKEATGP